jgi:hypothetical protein
MGKGMKTELANIRIRAPKELNTLLWEYQKTLPYFESKNTIIIRAVYRFLEAEMKKEKDNVLPFEEAK